MFKPNDLVVSKLTGEVAKVVRIVNDEIMNVRYKAKFIKGGFDLVGHTALIKNFRKY
jgi:hypothetical protein